MYLEHLARIKTKQECTIILLQEIQNPDKRNTNKRLRLDKYLKDEEKRRLGGA